MACLLQSSVGAQGRQEQGSLFGGAACAVEREARNRPREIREWGLSRCSEPFFSINLSVHFPLSSMPPKAISTLFLSARRLWAWPTPFLSLAHSLLRAALLGSGFDIMSYFYPSRLQYHNNIDLVPKNGPKTDTEGKLSQR